MQWLRWLPLGQIDWPKYVFLQTKALILSQSTAIKQRYRMKLFFVVFCFITQWVNWFTINVSLHVSFLLKPYGCIRVCKQTIGCLFLCFSPLFSVVQLWNYTETIIRLRLLGEYCRIRLGDYLPMFTSPSANNNIVNYEALSGCTY